MKNLKKQLGRIKYKGSIFFLTLLHPKESIFDTIYKRRIWNKNSQSPSGSGSDLKATVAIREAIPKLFHSLSVRSVIDAPCGDFHWMSTINLDIDKYIGMDIVSELISHNQKKYENETFRFMCGDITKDKLPKSDLILSRDCMIHLSNDEVFRCLRNFKNSGSTYILTTTFPKSLKKNSDIMTGMWRPINLQLPPFNFPEPIQFIMDREENGKSLGLWKIEDIPV